MLLEVSKKKLGTGGGGVIWLGRHKHHPDDATPWKLVAVKRKYNHISDRDGAPNPEEEHYLIDAIPYHPHIIPQMGWHTSTLDSTTYVALELMDGDFGNELTKGNVPNPNGTLQLLMLGLLSSLQHIHAYGVIHRDVKPSNILYRRDSNIDAHIDPIGAAIGLRVVLADFGAAHFATDQKREAMNIRGTRYYQAPEALYGRMLEEGVDAAASDIWATGCTFYELITGKKLFAGESALQILPMMLTKLGCSMSTYPNRDMATPSPLRVELTNMKVPNVTISLLEQMLELDPLRRLTAAELITNSYFDSARSDIANGTSRPFIPKSKQREFDESSLQFKDVIVKGNDHVNRSFDLDTSGCQTARTAASHHDHTCSQMRNPQRGLFSSCSTMKRSAVTKLMFTGGSTGAASESLTTCHVAGALFGDDEDEDDEVVGLHSNANNVMTATAEVSTSKEYGVGGGGGGETPTRVSPISPSCSTPSFRSQGRKMMVPVSGPVSFKTTKIATTTTTTAASPTTSSDPPTSSSNRVLGGGGMGRGLTNSAIKAQENYYNRLEMRGGEQQQQQQPIRTTTTSDARYLLSPPPQPRQMVYQSARNNNAATAVYVDTLSPNMHGSLPGVVSVPPSPQLVRIDEIVDNKENQRPLHNHHHHHSRQLDLNSSSDMSSMDGPPMSLPLKHAHHQQLCKPTPFVVSSAGATLVNTYRYTQQTTTTTTNTDHTNSPCLMRPMALLWSGSTGSNGTPGRALMQTLKCSPSARASASPRKHLRFEDSPVVKPTETPNPILSPLGPILSTRTGGVPSSSQPHRSEVNRYFNVCAMSVADEEGRVTLAPHQKRSAERSSADDIAAGCPRRALYPRTK